jgi:hypothetical protein
MNDPNFRFDASDRDSHIRLSRWGARRRAALSLDVCRNIPRCGWFVPRIPIILVHGGHPRFSTLFHGDRTLSRSSSRAAVVSLETTDKSMRRHNWFLLEAFETGQFKRE